MTGAPGNLRVEMVYRAAHVATTEGSQYVANDSSTWHDRRPFERADADLIGDRIVFRRVGN